MTQYSHMGYTRSTLHGLSADGVLKIASFGVKAAKLILLSRLLTPTDFGVFSLVTIALGLMESVTETGINTTIIQSKKSLSYFADTAWVISIVRGLAISVLMILIGFGMQRYYTEPLLLLYVAGAACIPIIRGFISPSVVKWYKELQFYRDASYRFTLVFADAVCTVILALFIPSAVALIGGIVLAALVEVVLSFGLFTPRPRFSYISSRAKEIFDNSHGLNLSAILNYLVENVDNLLIGKFVGTAQLGIYANGYSLSHKPNLELGKSVQRSTLPIYVRLADDAARLRRGFWKSTLLSLGLFSVCSLPLIFLPNWIVSTFLGAQWKGTEVILPLLTIAGLIQSFTVLSSTLFTATKRYFWLNANLFLNAITLIPLLFMTQKYGVIGGVWAVLLSRIVTVPVTGLGIWQTLYRPQKV